jgi:hypothetical protein
MTPRSTASGLFMLRRAMGRTEARRTPEAEAILALQ